MKLSKLTALVITFILGVFSQGFSNNPKSQLSVGTPASIFEQLDLENTAITSRYTFTSSIGEKILAKAEDYSLQDGYLSMVGRALESKNSEFILKGDSQEIYGWLILRDRNVAYEYTTSDGVIIANQVPISKIIPICDIQPPEGKAPESVMLPIQKAGPEPHIGPYPSGQNVNKLQSKPGSPKVLYLDNKPVMSGDNPKYMSKANMWVTWQILAAGLSMYDVNVITDIDLWNSTPAKDKGCARMLDQTGRSNCGNGWGTSRCCNLYKESNAYGQGRTALHEVGHLLGLGHDGGGGATDGYFRGIRAFEWVPIMGNYWYANSWKEALHQWSKGEYSGANNQQDDFERIHRLMEYRQDDISGTKPLIITGNGAVNAADNRGQIGINTDSDIFSFAIGGSGGNVKLTIDRTEHIGGGMLDVQAEIKNYSGKVVAESNKRVDRGAEFNEQLGSGNYMLVIQGGAEGTPSNGFSKYSSVGFYAIEGVIQNGIGVRTNNPNFVAHSIKVYSTPNNSRLNLELPETGQVKNITLYAINGSVVFNSLTKVNSIDVSEIKAGVYRLSLILNGSKVVKNVVLR